MGPVWEANHVWLIFVLVTFWTAFPAAFAAVMETLYVPLFLAALGIVLRGAAFALRGEAATIAESRALGATFALSSVVVPFFFGATVGAVAVGAVPADGNGDPFASWTGVVPLAIGVMAVVTGAYMAAVFLAGDAQRSELSDLVTAFRRRALGAALVAGAVALGGLLLVRSAAPPLYAGLTSGPGLVLVAGSALAGLVTLALVWRGRYGVARYTSAAAVAAVVLGWVVAQRPFLLPGQLTFSEAAAGPATMNALLVSVVIAAAVVGPSLYGLFRLVLRGRLEEELEPIVPVDDGSEAEPRGAEAP
jgi:cytochrome d ubiquinol oxidase subunit II